MSANILVGPLLGYEEGDYYTVCILAEGLTSAPTIKLSDKSKPISFVKQAGVGSSDFWRAEFKIAAGKDGTSVEYAIKGKAETFSDRHGRSKWRFYVPGKGEEPRIAYVSCNGFSSAELARDTDEPYGLWRRLAQQQTECSEIPQQEKPFSLLLMGGDQVYADEIWVSRRCPELQRWNELPYDQQSNAKPNAAMRAEIEAFYDWLYIDRWKDEQMSLMLSSIPSVMMWDDHDIFDGWGSYPKARQECAVFAKVFQEAARVFDVFQLRCSTRSRLNGTANHRTLALRFRGYQILVLDNRSERTLEQIMSDQQWHDVKGWLDGTQKPPKNLIVLTAVPVVYRSFAIAEKLFEATPWHEQLEDDVQDHWSAKRHEAERMRLIMVLLNHIDRHKNRCVILSGDVHVGALGRIWDAKRGVGLTQIISSGIVHPAPTPFEWLGIRMTTSDDPERLAEGDVIAEMLKPLGSDQYIRSRNFATFFTGTDDMIWVNWVCEENLKPSFGIA
ncbi:MAG TPA: alkaline phosphatase D family protein [Chthoniobacterales bacterium]|nr:alkaline phosphatase D family protein [Chthoniobacterales bacterium]